MADRYWVGAAGNWSDTAKWSLTSGGAGGASVPTASDVAIFNSLSNTGTTAWTVTVDVAAPLLGLTCTPDASLTFASAGNLSVSGNTQITCSSGTREVIMGATGATLGNVTLTTGTFRVNGFTVNMNSFTSASATVRTLSFGSGTGVINITGNSRTVWNVTNAGTSTITGTSTSRVDLTYSGGTGTRTVIHRADTGTLTPSFDIKAGTDTVALGGITQIKNLDTTGFSGTLSWSGATAEVEFYNSLTIASTTTLASSNREAVFRSNLTTSLTMFTLVNNGKRFDCNVIMNLGSSTSSGMTLSENLLLSSTRTLTITSGTLVGNAFSVECGRFVKTVSAGALTFTTGYLDLYGNNATVLNVNVAVGGNVTRRWRALYTGGTGTRTFNYVQGTAGLDALSIAFSGTPGLYIDPASTDTIKLTGSCAYADFTGSSNVIDTSGNLILYGLSGVSVSTVIPTGLTVTGAGTWTLTQSFGAPATHVLDIAPAVPFNLTINNSSATRTCSLVKNLTTTGAVALSRGVLSVGTNIITASSLSSGLSTNMTLDLGADATFFVTGTSGTVLNMDSMSVPSFQLTIDVNGAGTSRTLSCDSASIAVKVSAGTGDTFSAGFRSRGLDFTGYTGSITLSSYTAQGNLVFVSGMTVSSAGALTLGVPFGGTGTITSAGKTIATTVNVNASSSTWQLSDNLTVSSNVTLTAGNLALNNYEFRCLTFSCSGSTSARGLFAGPDGSTSGTGQIFVRPSATGSAFVALTNTNLTVYGTSSTTAPLVTVTPAGSTASQIFAVSCERANSNTAAFDIVFGGTHPGPTFDLGTSSVGNVTISNVTCTVRNTAFLCYGNYLIAGTTPTFTAGSVVPRFIRPTNTSATFTTNGKTLPFPIRFESEVVGSSAKHILQDNVTVTAATGTVLATNGHLDLNGKTLTTFALDCDVVTSPNQITYGGGRIDLTGSSTTICDVQAQTTVNDATYITLTPGGSSNRTFSYRPTLGAGVSHPDLVQSGTSGINLGTDGGSFISMGANVASVNLPSFPGYSLSGGLTVFSGSVATSFFLSTTSLAITMEGSSSSPPTNTISIGSAQLGSLTVTNCNTTLLGSLTLGTNGLSISSSSALNKTFDTGSNAISTPKLTTSGAVTLALGDSEVTISGDLSFVTLSAGSISAGTSRIRLTSGSGNDCFFVSGNNTFYDLVIGGTFNDRDLIFSGGTAYTFNSFSSTRGGPHGVTFPAGSTVTVNTWGVTGGNALYRVVLQSSIPGSQFNLVKATGGPVTAVDYLNIRDSAASPSTATWYAGANSTDSGNNSGWIFSAVPGGAGNMFFFL